MKSYLNNVKEFQKIGYILINECTSEDYKLLNENFNSISKDEILQIEKELRELVEQLKLINV